MAGPPYYWQKLNQPKGLLSGYMKLLEAIAAYEVRATAATVPGDRVIFQRKANEVRALVEWMWREYERVGVEGAVEADRIIRKHIRMTASGRPTAGQSGRLEKSVVSRPKPIDLATGAWPVGGVGIADLKILDTVAVNPRYHGRGKKSYWMAQEFGLPALTPADYTSGGRKVAPGFFQPGNSAPNRGQFRNHPYFEQMPYAKGMPALMRLRAVPARHFLRDGTAEYAALRRVQIGRINQQAVNRLMAI